MNVSKYAWSHPVDYQQAKSRLIGRQRYLVERRRFAGQRREDLVLPLLLKYGFGWGSLSRIAREIGCHRSTIMRDRNVIWRSMLGY
jgi:hypothetical protein